MKNGVHELPKDALCCARMNSYFFGYLEPQLRFLPIKQETMLCISPHIRTAPLISLYEVIRIMALSGQTSDTVALTESCYHHPKCPIVPSSFDIGGDRQFDFSH